MEDNFNVAAEAVCYIQRMNEREGERERERENEDEWTERQWELNRTEEEEREEEKVVLVRPACASTAAEERVQWDDSELVVNNNR